MNPATRFETYAKSQNLGLAAIKSIKDTEVLNTVTNKLKDVTKDLEDRAKSLIGGMLPANVSLADVEGSIKEGIRAAKDTFSAIRDLSGFSVMDIEKEIAGMLPGDPALQNAFRTLTTQCRNNALSKSPGFKPYDDKLSCGNPGDGKCQSGEVNNFFNKMTDGAMGLITKTFQAMLQALMALGNLGYSGGLCKIFATLVKGLPNGIVQRGAAGLLANLGGAGNIPAVLDIAGNMGSANPSLEIPGLVKRISENFAIPVGFNSDTFSSLYEGVKSSLGFIQPGHDTYSYSLTGSIDTISSMGLKNASFSTVTSSYLKDTVLGSFSTPVVKDDWARASSYVSSKVKDPFAGLL